MIARKRGKPTVLIEHGPTRYTTQPGDPVWASVGQGWCAGVAIRCGREAATVKFTTGAKEPRPYLELRWRKPQLEGADKPA